MTALSRLLEQLSARDGCEPVLATEAWPSTQGQVWKLHVGSRALALKIADASALSRERDALRRCQALRAGLTPRIVHELPGPPRALVITWLEGARPSNIGTDTHREAGRSLRRLHQLALNDTDPLPIEEAYARRWSAWLQRGRAELPGPLLDAIAARADPSVVAGRSRVLCHRDFTPSNWVVDDAGRVGIVDFGQARPDLALWDQVKLNATAWRHAPHLRTAFLRGYDCSRADDDSVLRQLTLLHGLQTMVWGLQHRESSFAELGRAIVEFELSLKKP